MKLSKERKEGKGFKKKRERDWRERLELGIEKRKKRGLERSTGNRIGVKEGEGIWKEGR